MDFPLSSSVILMVAVVLWIVWVAPYVLRNRGQRVLAAGESMLDAIDEETQEPQAGTVLKLAAQQEKPMETLQSTSAAATGTREERGQKTAPGTGKFRIRYGRCAIALVGVGMLLTAFVSGVLRAFGVGSTWLPIGALLVTAAAVFLLRVLAVRDRRAKVKAAFESAMRAPSTPTAARPAEGSYSGERRESAVFDAEAGRTEPAPLSALELRQAALAVAAAAGDTPAPAPRKVSNPAPAEAWEPVEVPKPTYVDAAKADRPAPEPLDLPEAPKPIGKPSLKQGVTTAVATAQAEPAAPVAGPTAAGATGKGQSALSNLDDVLQRRRA